MTKRYHHGDPTAEKAIGNTDGYDAEQMRSKAELIELDRLARQKRLAKKPDGGGK